MLVSPVHLTGGAIAEYAGWGQDNGNVVQNAQFHTAHDAKRPGQVLMNSRTEYRDGYAKSLVYRSFVDAQCGHSGQTPGEQGEGEADRQSGPADERQGPTARQVDTEPAVDGRANGGDRWHCHAEQPRDRAVGGRAPRVDRRERHENHCQAANDKLQRHQTDDNGDRALDYRCPFEPKGKQHTRYAEADKTRQGNARKPLELWRVRQRSRRGVRVYALEHQKREGEQNEQAAIYLPRLKTRRRLVAEVPAVEHSRQRESAHEDGNRHLRPTGESLRRPGAEPRKKPASCVRLTGGPPFLFGDDVRVQTAVRDEGRRNHARRGDKERRGEITGDGRDRNTASPGSRPNRAALRSKRQIRSR